VLAVRWHGQNDVRVEDVAPPPPPGPGEVQVRVEWCGICGTDMEEMRHGPIFIPVDEPHPITGRTAPLTLGHEFAGVIEAAGDDVGDLEPGDRVAVDTIVYCGRCHWCRRNEVVRCEQFGALGLQGDGGLAELCNAPAAMCLPIPDGVGTDAAALAETLSVGVRALKRGRFRPGEHVAVVGVGAVGLMTVQAARALGASSVSVIDPAAERRELALALGAGAAHAQAAPLGVDVAVESAGDPRAVEAAIAAVGKGGRAVLLGIDKRPATFEPLRLVVDEAEIIGALSHVYDEDFRLALDLLARDSVRAEPLITDRVPIGRAVEDGLTVLATEPERHLKILVDPQAS
jgi:(R,R)-butanediol dehydrogenase / meso-butanediol dehydrogenase / diacetyl reductase